MNRDRKLTKFAAFQVGVLALSFGLPLFPSLAVTSNEITLGTSGNYSLVSGGVIVLGATTHFSGTARVALASSPAVIDSTTIAAFQTAGLQIFDNGNSAALTAVNNVAALKSQLESLTATSIPAEIGGESYTAGIYSVPVGTAMTMASTITLDGGGAYNSVFVFRTTEAITIAADLTIRYVNGAQPSNIFWISGAATNLGARTIIPGNFIAGAAITTGESSTVIGSLLGLGAVTLGATSEIIHNLAVSAPTVETSTVTDTSTAPDTSTTRDTSTSTVTSSTAPIYVPIPRPAPQPSPTPISIPEINYDDIPIRVVEVELIKPPPPIIVPKIETIPVQPPSKPAVNLLTKVPKNQVIEFETIRLLGRDLLLHISLHNLIPGQSISISLREFG